MFYKWNMLALTFLLDALPFRICDAAKCSLFSRPPNFLWSVVWIFMLVHFTSKSISICWSALWNSEGRAFGGGYVYVWVCVYVWWAVPDIQLLSLSLSAILMRLCSNTYKRIACAIYKQSKIIVFDEWANGGLYMHIGCVSCGFRLLLSTCERRCRTEFLAELTGQGLSTL